MHIDIFYASNRQVNTAGRGCHWDNLLVANLGYWEERARLYINVHSTGTNHNSRHLSILVERSPSLGKVQNLKLSSKANYKKHLLSRLCLRKERERERVTWHFIECVKKGIQRIMWENINFCFMTIWDYNLILIESDNQVLTIDAILLIICGSVGGAVLLVVGLYSVLWGKNREDRKSETNEQRQESKEEIVLECITHH